MYALLKLSERVVWDPVSLFGTPTFQFDGKAKWKYFPANSIAISERGIVLSENEDYLEVSLCGCEMFCWAIWMPINMRYTTSPPWCW